jgi:dipeptidyl aminopeptidase/acylaminoacyl peptidase
MKYIYRTSLLILMCIFSACASATPDTSMLPPAVVTIIRATLTPSITPTPTATQTMNQALLPFTIEGLRKHDFQSGTLTLGPAILETDLFTRYAIKYPSDGLTITGILQVPKTGTPPYPVIVMNHGFFSRYVYYSGDGTDRAAEFLNRRGYLTVSSDYRSWGEAELGESLFYSGLAIDVINLMNAVSEYELADPERIGMWGHSMGGGTTLKVLTIDSRVKAAVLYATVSGDFEDIIGRWGTGCLGDILQGEATYGCNSSDIIPLDLPQDLIDAYFKGSTDQKMLEAVSPIHHLKYVTAPVQINYGTEDGKVASGAPPEWSKDLYQAFLDAEKEAYLIGVEGEEHSFKYDAWFHFMERSAQFFDKYVR